MPYRFAAGDYRGGFRGDPGLFGSIFRRIKGIATGIVGMSPIGAIAKTVIGAIAPRREVSRMPTLRPVQATMFGQKGPTTPTRISPMGTRGPEVCPAGHHFSKTTGSCVPNRRMNVGNARALRRAIRRQSGFVKLARRALRGSGYSIVSKGAGRRRVSIKEAGPGSVTVQ